jgi:S1-C subfamily serine protease
MDQRVKQTIGVIILFAMLVAVCFLGAMVYKEPEQVNMYSSVADAVVLIEVQADYSDDYMYDCPDEIEATQVDWSGAGTIIDEKGTILTVAHVLEGAAAVTVTLADGRKYEVDVETIYVYPGGSDNFVSEPDVGFCRIDCNDALPVAVMAESSMGLPVGTEITIHGHPFLEHKWTSFGHIARPVVNGQLQCVIDANPGNSGGPIIYNNEVIGVISWGYRATDLSFGPGIELCRSLLEVYRMLYAGETD